MVFIYMHVHTINSTACVKDVNVQNTSFSSEVYDLEHVLIEVWRLCVDWQASVGWVGGGRDEAGGGLVGWVHLSHLRPEFTAHNNAGFLNI